jgi:hypothetical protein
MKKNVMKFFYVMIAIVMILPVTSCSKDDDNGVQSYQLALGFDFPSGLEASNIGNVKLVMTKGTKNDTIKLTTLKDTVLSLAQGQYSFTVLGKVKDEAAAYISGTTSVDLYANTSSKISIQKVVQSPLIFKAIYTTGGKSGYVMDEYFEIVNNSDEVQYLDGLILSSPTGNQKTANAWQANGYTDIYECGQGTVVAFPGTGKDYPIQPGQSVVVANDAANHNVLAPAGNLCPDLSGANWEIYISNVTGEVDYSAPNLDVIFQNNTYMKAFGLGFFGRGYILAKLPDGMTPAGFAANASNIMTTPGTTSTMQYLMIPSKYVLDAVDIWNPGSETHYGTFLAADDAQGVLASTAWAGKCVRRKVTKIVNGRAYYQDTNNSSNDFLNGQDLTPGKTPTSVDE